MARALVAHVSPLMCGAMLGALRNLYFETAAVTNSNALLARLGEQKPELLVIDSELPPFGAVQAIRSVRSFDNGDAKIIAVVQGIDFDLVSSLHNVGANEVITGGYSSEKLLTKLRVLKLLAD